VDQRVQATAERLTDRAEDAGDVVIAGHIAGDHRVCGVEPARQFAHRLLQAFPLVGEGEAHPGIVQRLGDPPGDTPLVRHAEDQTRHPVELSHRTHPSTRYPRRREHRLRALPSLKAYRGIVTLGEAIQSG